MVSSSAARYALIAAAAAASLGGGQRAEPPPYAVVGHVPDRVDGQVFRTFACDPAANRLYAGSDRGLFWIDLAEPTRIKGPLFRKDIRKLEFAENLGRLFYFTDEEVGFIDVGEPESPKRLSAGMRALDLAYEPVRRELYVATRDPWLHVFQAHSGERTRIDLPGWFASSLEAAPGRVYMNVSPKTSLYVVEADTHRVSPWPVSGTVVFPGYLEADPAGHYLFAAYDRYVSAIDARTATVVGRIIAPKPVSIAFDAGARLLLASWDDSIPPPVRVVAYRVDEKGLTQVARLGNPANGIVGVARTHRGFIQHGVASLIVWAFREPAKTDQRSTSLPLARARAAGWPSSR